ncbi:MAG: A24 family peptidase [Syntrophomonadaceae bacterium]|jgi:prepilin peptidase CpaA
MLMDIILICLILIAVVVDLRSRRIPNILIGLGLVLAIGYNIYTSGLSGTLFSLKGLGVGMLLLILPFMSGGMGAGDVKLLGMIGAFKGSWFVFNAFIFMALWGGLIIVIILIHKKQLVHTVKKIISGLLLLPMGLGKAYDHMDKGELAIYYPYGLAIGLGVVTCFIKGGC